ncbi:hypothetical protein AMTRI_Chr07g29160 [Amborella trichopoda]
MGKFRAPRSCSRVSKETGNVGGCKWNITVDCSWSGGSGRGKYFQDKKYQSSAVRRGVTELPRSLASDHRYKGGGAWTSGYMIVGIRGKKIPNSGPHSVLDNVKMVTIPAEATLHWSAKLENPLVGSLCPLVGRLEHVPRLGN